MSFREGSALGPGALEWLCQRGRERMELHLSTGFAGDGQLSGAGAEEKDLEVLVEEKLGVSRQSVLPAQEATPVLGCMERSEEQQVKGGDCGPPVHFLRPHLERYIRVWRPQHKKDLELPE